MAQSLRGQFLVAGPNLRDPNFFKTVVLILEHAAEGAMGLVVNRPSSLSVGNALAGHLDLPDADEMVYVGGPVEPADLFLLHTDEQSADQFGGGVAIVPGVYVTNSAEEFEAVLTKDGSMATCKVFSGYAGWGDGQLEGELSRGDWLIAHADTKTIFRDPVYELWDDLRSKVQRSHRLFPSETPNPELN